MSTSCQKEISDKPATMSTMKSTSSMVKREDMPCSPILDCGYENHIVLVQENECHLTMSIKTEQLQDVKVKQEPSDDTLLFEEQDCRVQVEEPLLKCKSEAEWNSSTPDVAEQPLEDWKTEAPTIVPEEGAKHAENYCLKDEDQTSSFESFNLAHTTSPRQQDSGLVLHSEPTESTRTPSELQHLQTGTCHTTRNASTEVPQCVPVFRLNCKNVVVVYPEKRIRWRNASTEVPQCVPVFRLNCKNVVVVYPEKRIQTAQVHCQRGYTNKLCSCHLYTTKYNSCVGVRRCSYCSQTFATQQALKSHVRDQHERPFKCDFCDKTFRTRSVLTVHRRSHTGEKPCACSHCPAAFRNGSALRMHILTAHSTERPHVCEYCGKSFAVRPWLESHKIVHTGNTPHLCHLCPARFTRHASLVVHLRSHSNERPYPCEHCGKCFATSGRRATHIKCVHSTERPYVCKYCGKSYTLPLSLKRHEIVHTGNTSHVCHLCPARFTMRMSLVIHLRSHSNERPYSCEQCGKCFTTSGRRTVHIKGMHSSEPAYACKVCHKKYKHKGGLYVHLRDHHPAEAKA